MSFNALPPHVISSESNPQTVPSDLFDHLSWVKNQSSSSTQQATLAAPTSPRPISSPGLIQSHSQSPSSSPLASSSRNVGRPFSEHAADMRCTCHPPPVAAVLTSHPPPAREHSARNFRAPYEPFLSDAPPPPDSWIAVETSQADYRLNVRLPGFRRDAITLAAGRRRILHVVADSWEPGGGHFERRISFGYDADLRQVRAEFDGEILRVTVPRRAPALTWYGGEACE
ncbi:hypothetical protein BGW80DRAFT_1164732 [Lactifluus volemus]|nr:hypothetical protein BGW80DRAFT_1164732 [Lactifluus volemus]